MRRTLWIAATFAATILVACTPDARRRAMEFFFEIPEESPAPVADSATPPADSQSIPVATAEPEGAEPRFASVHMPYESGDCEFCHSPANRMNVAEDAADSCGSCHDDYFDEDLVMHMPVADGDCSMCHLPHRSKFKGLLKDTQVNICSECHASPAELAEDAEVHAVKGVENCSMCHNAHFGENYLLKEDLPDIPELADYREDDSDDE